MSNLLAPRFKVIADYPGTYWKVGMIIDNPEKLLTAFERYPHLFKRLEWWEHRYKPEEGSSGKYIKEFDVLPQYIKSKSTGIVYKVIWYSVDIYDDVSCLVEHESGSKFRALSDMDVSTSEEYEAYINSINTNGK